MNVMALTATAHSTPESLRQDVVVDGRFHLVTDEPERLGGDDSAPSPHELLPAAIASCVSTTLLMYARTKSWQLGHVDVDVAYDPVAPQRRCNVTIHVEAPLTGAQLERLQKVAATCPVRRALEGAVTFTEQIV